MPRMTCAFFSGNTSPKSSPAPTNFLPQKILQKNSGNRFFPLMVNDSNEHKDLHSVAGSTSKNDSLNSQYDTNSEVHPHVSNTQVTTLEVFQNRNLKKKKKSILLLS